MTPNCISRFAPSPTGRLHLGHAYSALLAQDLARVQGGQFVLRIEDIDETRCRPEFVDNILEDLQWLGILWDGPVLVQSTRRAAYQAALDRLIEAGLAYKCWCTRAEIAAAAGAPQGDQPVYPGTCRGRADPGDGRPFCWRLDHQQAVRRVGTLSWQDAKAGSVLARPELLGDVVIARKDAGTSYHIAVVVDDAAQGVTDIVRGEDLFEATHIHRLLQALLDLPVPTYHHHRLILDGSGERLAKRRNSETLADLRAKGITPEKLIQGLRQGLLPADYRLAD